MMMQSLALLLVTLTGPDGQTIHVNPEQVTSIREPRFAHRGHYPPGTGCILYVTNGHFIAAQEPCAVVRKRLEAER